MKSFNAAIFDMDGTLLDSMVFWEKIIDKYLAYKEISIPKDVHTAVNHMSMLEIAQYLKEQFNLPDAPHQIVDEINMHIEDDYKNNIPLKPYVYEFLSSLCENGVKLCVATASDRHLAEHALTRLGINKFFEFVITCTEVGEGKQSPKIFLTACQKLGFSPNETAVFEDDLHAMTTAKATGFYTVGIEDGSNILVRREIKEVADFYISSYKAARREIKL